MKDKFLNANFPRSADNRVYHLGIREGEVANRIITVGSPSRAQSIAKLLDNHPKPFTVASERGFLTITGRFRGVPMSIVSIGMGNPNMDFFVREIRECLSGNMVVIRLGSCGALIDVPVGSIAVPRASISVARNYDFNFLSNDSQAMATGADGPYRISKPVRADPDLHAAVLQTLESATADQPNTVILSASVNASADSFYSSQGRQTSFPDRNEDLIRQLLLTDSDLATLEMETFHLFHLASTWRQTASIVAETSTLPVTTTPVKPIILDVVEHPNRRHSHSPPEPRILAASVQMIFANRTSQDFISPVQVVRLEEWCGKCVLQVLHDFEILPELEHNASGSVWEI